MCLLSQNEPLFGPSCVVVVVVVVIVVVFEHPFSDHRAGWGWDGCPEGLEGGVQAEPAKKSVRVCVSFVSK